MPGRRWVPILVVMALGCSGGEAPPVPVYGRVTFRGYPVPGGVVAFTPDRERGHAGAAGRADLGPDGGFRVAAGGLQPGWYRVTVASLQVCLPARYRDPDSGNLVREVTAGGENRIDLVLDD